MQKIYNFEFYNNKPSGGNFNLVENGASYIEIDTGRVYRYDKENNRWIEGKE